LAAVEDHLGEHGEVGRGAEQTGMTGHAAQGVRVLVVHLTAERVATWWSDLGGGNAVAERVGGAEERVRHAERLEDALVQELIERLPGDALDEEAERHGAEIGVDVAEPGLALERCGEDDVAGLLRRGGEAPEVAVRRETGAVLEELADGDRILVAAG